MSKSLALVILTFININLYADVSPEMSGEVITSSENFVRRLFAGTESQKFEDNRWKVCREGDFDNSEAFGDINSITSTSCKNSIDLFVREAMTSTEVGAKEQFCDRFVEELVDNPNNDNAEGACPAVRPSDEALSEFKTQCASKLLHIRAQRMTHYGQMFQETERSHKESIIEYLKEYKELSEKQNDLLGELMSAQDDSGIAIEGLVCLPDTREEVINCDGVPKFDGYLAANYQDCMSTLGDEEACRILHPTEEEIAEQSTAKTKREDMINMAQQVIPKFAKNELDDLLAQNKSAGEAFISFQKSMIDSYVQNSLGVSRENNEEVYSRNANLIYSSLGSLEKLEELSTELNDPESEASKSCENPCEMPFDYMMNHLTFPEGVTSFDDKKEITIGVMRLMSGLNRNSDMFQSRYKAMQLIHRLKQNNEAGVTEDELREAGFLRNGTLNLFVENNEDINSTSAAFGRIIAGLNVADNEGNRPSTFEVFKRFNQMERDSSAKSCDAFKTKFEGLCSAISENKPTLAPDETEQCLDFAFNETYRDDLQQMWRNNNYSNEQVNSNYYELVGLSCIVAQESFTDNDSEAIRHFRRRIGGESINDIVSDNARDAVDISERSERNRLDNMSPRERAIEDSDLDDSLLPEMDENPFGDSITVSRNSSNGNLKDGSLKSGRLNNSKVAGGGGAAAGAFAGLAKGSVDGFNSGFTGINNSLPRDSISSAGDAVTNIENNIDPSDPRYSSYLTQIDDLKASLAALESRLAGNPLPGGEGVPQSSTELLALQAEIEKERAELEKMRAELAAKLNEDGTNVTTGGPSGVDVNVATSFASPAAAEAIAPPVEEALEGGETAAPVSSSMAAPSYGDGSGVRGGGYDGSLFLTATTNEDLIAQYGAPIEIPRSELEGRIMQAVNLDLLEPGQPVYKELGEDRYLRYTLLENGEIEIKNIILEDAKKPEQNNQDDDVEVNSDPKIRYEQFEKL